MGVKLNEMTLKEVREKEFEVAILPWGSCEPHNLHLPYGIDALTAEKIAEISAQKAEEKGGKVAVLPVIPIGTNSNTLKFPLTLNLFPTTQFSILQDIVHSLQHHGVKKLVILNGHGGNEFKFILRELYGKTSLHLFLINFWEVGKDVCREIFEDTEGEHGDEKETSWALYLFPKLVHLEWADEGKVRTSRLEAINKGWVWMTRPWHLLTENSGYGNPRKASLEKGKRFVKVVTNRIASFLVELSRVKIDDKFLYR